jgi:arabinofuranan 3-O-arabinosyltransferase
LALGYLIVLGGSYLQGHFLTDPQGRPIANDFVNVWAAGRLARDGAAPAAYDWTLHRAAEVRAVGYDFDGYYGWHYPPPAFFFAAVLATLPYLVAAVVWLLTTLAAYAAAIAGILGLRTGVLFALGFPAAIWNVTAGQNGFLTAALIGGTLGLLERHPALAGICLGLLTYKPQFGLLFPIVLIADRRWLTIAVAALVALLLAALSWLVFGSASWVAFAHWAPISNRVLIDQGALDWYRLQSVFALVRAHGGSETLAWIVQGILMLALAVGLVWLWKSRAAFELKAAALAAGALLATPYLFMYDLVVLAVAVAFLLRLALAREFLSRIEIVALATAGALILIYPYVKTQVGLAAVVIVMVLIVHRASTQARTALAGTM